MASTPILPLALWQSGTNQNSIPANDNALRLEALNREIVSQAVTAQPASPAAGDTYIIAATHTGAQWSGFTPKDIAIFKAGTWYAWAPTEGLIVNVAGDQFKYDGGAWISASGGGGSSRTPAEQAVTSAATVTPKFSDDIVVVTAQAVALTLANPSGTAIPNLGIAIRIKDNGTARAISYGSQYRAVGVGLPTTTVANKTLYLAGIWNVADTRFDIVAVAQQ